MLHHTYCLNNKYYMSNTKIYSKLTTNMHHHNVVLGYTIFLSPTIMVTYELNISVDRWQYI
jgi:hypothetical protein